jgi:hypothetical protein
VAHRHLEYESVDWREESLFAGNAAPSAAKAAFITRDCVRAKQAAISFRFSRRL